MAGGKRRRSAPGPAGAAGAAAAGAAAAGNDEAIIAALADDARMPVARLAKRIGMSETGARKRIARLVGDGTVRFTVERGDGGGAKAIVLVSAESASDISKISASLSGLAAGGGSGGRKGKGAGSRGGTRGAAGKDGRGAWRATTAKIYEITGQHDIAIIMGAAGIREINETIDTVRRVPGVTDTNTVIILRTVA